MRVRSFFASQYARTKSESQEVCCVGSPQTECETVAFNLDTLERWHARGHELSNGSVENGNRWRVAVAEALEAGWEAEGFALR